MGQALNKAAQATMLLGQINLKFNFFKNIFQLHKYMALRLPTFVSTNKKRREVPQKCRKRMLLRLVEAVKAVLVRVPICKPAVCCSFINFSPKNYPILPLMRIGYSYLYSFYFFSLLNGDDHQGDTAGI